MSCALTVEGVGVCYRGGGRSLTVQGVGVCCGGSEPSLHGRVWVVAQCVYRECSVCSLRAYWGRRLSCPVPQATAPVRAAALGLPSILCRQVGFVIARSCALGLPFVVRRPVGFMIALCCAAPRLRYLSGGLGCTASFVGVPGQWTQRLCLWSVPCRITWLVVAKAVFSQLSAFFV